MPVLNGKWEGVVSRAMTLHSQSTREIQKRLQMNFIISLSRLELKHLMLPNPWLSFTISLHQQILPRLVEDKFQFHTVSTHESRKIIMSFSSNKAPGLDKITMSVIKDSLPCTLPLQTSNNNRPLLLLPVASRVCEWVALNQLTTYMTNKEKLTEHQRGNKKLHSCETLNIMMTDKAREATDAKKLTLVVLLDLSKAFEGTCSVVQQINDHSRNLENSFLNHFLSAKRVTYCCFYLYYYNFNV